MLVYSKPILRILKSIIEKKKEEKEIKEEGVLDHFSLSFHPQ